MTKNFTTSKTVNFNINNNYSAYAFDFELDDYVLLENMSIRDFQKLDLCELFIKYIDVFTYSDTTAQFMFIKTSTHGHTKEQIENESDFCVMFELNEEQIVKYDVINLIEERKYAKQIVSQLKADEKAKEQPMPMISQDQFDQLMTSMFGMNREQFNETLNNSRSVSKQCSCDKCMEVKNKAKQLPDPKIKVFNNIQDLMSFMNSDTEE